MYRHCLKTGSGAIDYFFLEYSVSTRIHMVLNLIERPKRMV